MLLEPEWQVIGLCLQTPGGPTPYIESDPGWAKTSRFEQLIARLETAGVVIPASMHQDPAEANGFPTIDPQTGELRFQPSPIIKRLIRETEKKGGKGMGLIDEITTVPPATTAGFLRLVHEGWAGDQELPRARYRWAIAGNPPETSVGGYEAPTALMNRCCVIRLQTPRFEVWEKWVMGIDLFNEILILDLEKFEKSLPRAKSEWLAFERANPGSFVKPPPEGGEYAYPTLRTNEYAFRLLAACYAVGEAKPVDIPGEEGEEDDSGEKTGDEAEETPQAAPPPEGSEVLYVALRGVVGPSKARTFLKWRYSADLPDPEDLLAKPELFEHDPSRLDRTYAILDSVAMSASRKLKSKVEARQRRHAAWKILLKAATSGAKGVVVNAMVALSEGTPMEDDLPDEGVEAVNECRDMLRQAGVKFA